MSKRVRDDASHPIEEGGINDVLDDVDAAGRDVRGQLDLLHAREALGRDGREWLNIRTARDARVAAHGQALREVDIGLVEANGAIRHQQRRAKLRHCKQGARGWREQRA